MNVCVISDDRMIQVDGEVLNFDFSIDLNIHAIQWDGSAGHVEFKDNTPNEDIADFSEYQGLVDAHSAEKIRVDNEKQAKSDAYIAEEEARMANFTYAENRKIRYDLLNQFELQFNDATNGTTTWEDAVNAIKAEFPKI